MHLLSFCLVVSQHGISTDGWFAIAFCFAFSIRLSQLTHGSISQHSEVQSWPVQMSPNFEETVSTQHRFGPCDCKRTPSTVRFAGVNGAIWSGLFGQRMDISFLCVPGVAAAEPTWKFNGNWLSLPWSPSKESMLTSPEIGELDPSPNMLLSSSPSPPLWWAPCEECDSEIAGDDDILRQHLLAISFLTWCSQSSKNSGSVPLTRFTTCGRRHMS